jgi:RNA 2',3'-cyclic 3'-phosphodiesterase
VSAGARAATRRLFLALWPTPAERDALLQAAAAVACAGRAVPAPNLHVTLAFLGAVPEPRIATLTALAAELGALTPAPLVLCFTRLEYWRRPQILVALTGAEPPGAAQLAAQLKRACAAAGFFPDLKPFRAHVTVARQVAAAGADAELSPVTWQCARLVLAESRSSPAGPLYSVLDSWLLGKPENMRTDS